MSQIWENIAKFSICSTTTSWNVIHDVCCME